MPAPEDLRARLESLELAGARAFDSPSVRLIGTLLERAGEIGGRAAERLRARVGARLDLLEQRFAAARGAAVGAAGELVAAGFDRGDMDAALVAGDLVAVARAVRRGRALPGRRGRLPRRLPVIPSVRPERPRLILADMPQSQAARPEATAGAPATRQQAAATLAERYRVTLAEISTTMRIERARRTLPAEAGPYNGQVIAARLLETLAELAPVYAHAQIERMRELAVLAGLPEAAAPAQGAPATSAPSKPSGKSSGKSAGKPSGKSSGKPSGRASSKPSRRLAGQRASKPATPAGRSSRPSAPAKPASKRAPKSPPKAPPASGPAPEPASGRRPRARR